MIIEREALYNELIKAASNTPLVELKNINISGGNRFFLKLEYLNPVGSVHLRVYPYVFRNAEALGFIKPHETPVIEASFGNAGAAFAYCANQLGYNIPLPPTVVIPSNISDFRLNQLKALNARLLFSPSERFNLGYVELLESELEKDKLLKGNSSRIDTHRLYPVTKTRKNAKLPYRNLINEVYEVFGNFGIKSIDYFIGIIGSGTSISGIGERLKELNSESKIMVAEPREFRNSTSLFEHGRPLPLSSVPKNFPYLTAIGVPLKRLNLNKNIIDGIIQYEMNSLSQLAEKIKLENDLNLGLTTLGSISAALTIAKGTKDKNYLICAYDEGHKWI